MRKIKVGKLIADLMGFTIGGVASIWMVIKTYAFLKHGGIIFYELNPVISIIEFISATFGTSYFGYRLAKLLTKKEIEKYIED